MPIGQVPRGDFAIGIGIAVDKLKGIAYSRLIHSPSSADMQDHPKLVKTEDLGFRWERAMYPLALAIGIASGSCDARADTVGAHLYSLHFNVDRDAPESLQPRDVTPGLYWRGDSGLTAGVVRNSYSRPSVYAGYTLERGRFSLTLAAISGYRYKTYTGPAACGKQSRHKQNVDPNTCWWTVGHTSAVLRPLIAPSVSFPEAKPYIGATPRVALLGKAISFSVEWEL